MGLRGHWLASHLLIFLVQAAYSSAGAWAMTTASDAIEYAAQDGTGKVWSVRFLPSLGTRCLSVWEQEGWREITFSIPDSWR